MEAASDFWIFAIFIGVLVLAIIVMAIREFRAQRNIPGLITGKRANRKIALEILRDFLRIKKKNKDNPMKKQDGDNGIFF